MMYKWAYTGLLLVTAVFLAACDVPAWIVDNGETATPQGYRAAATVSATGTPIDAVDSGSPTAVQEALATGSAELQTAAGSAAPPQQESAAEICSDAGSGNSLSYQQALDIAMASECAEVGNILPAHFCSQKTGAWWIGLHTLLEGCNPACVVDINSRAAVVNWRCSMVTTPTVETAQPEQPEHLEQPAVATQQTNGASQRFTNWQGIITRQPHGALVAYRFQRDDGHWFDIGTHSNAIRQQFAGAAWSAAKVILSGEETAVPDAVDVQILTELDARTQEARNLTSFAMASSSSQLASDDGGTYHAWSAVDGSLAQPWCEGVEGSGAGEWLQLDFSAPLEVNAVRLANGYQSGDYLYTLNNRVQTASILLDDKHAGVWDILDSRDWQSYTIAAEDKPGIVASSVRLLIEDTIAGWEFDDSCIAEVEVWGKPVQ